MQIKVMNPAHPKDKSQAKALSVEQFSVVHDYIVGCMNSRGGKIKEAEVLRLLDEAGLPLFPVSQGEKA